jgi:hypothetical protein
MRSGSVHRRSAADRCDPFAALIPAAAERMPVAWDALRVPGPPAAFALTPRELDAPAPLERFHRRTIQLLDCAGAGGDRLALVDKAMPHALHDLMLSEASAVDKPTPADVAADTGRALWRTGLEFVRFVSDPGSQRTFGLEGGELHLALNCDPNTADRESVQAAKQFHLHLLYWTAGELAALRAPGRLSEQTSARRRRQYLDPLSFTGARVIQEALAGLELVVPGARLAPLDEHAVIAGKQPLGCVIRLPGWQVLASAEFEDLIRRLHGRLRQAGERLCAAFTGESAPPAPWRRHPLLPVGEIRARLARQGWPASVTEGLLALAAGLRDLHQLDAARLRRASAAARSHCMTLNQPCYGLNLHAPRRNDPGAPLIDAGHVDLIIQTKLFSAVGGAGLLTLGGIPSVRILRGQGTYSPGDWRRRAAFQRAFALHNTSALKELIAAGCAPVRRLEDFERGWV